MTDSNPSRSRVDWLPIVSTGRRGPLIGCPDPGGGRCLPYLASIEASWTASEPSIPVSIEFYQNLPIRERFADVADPSVYSSVPDDWLVFSSDVDGSTEAIQTGRYKEVNTVGASTIVSLLNVAKNASPSIEVPFLFGGDGATVVMPPSLEGSSRSALIAARRISRDVFNLDLRIGVLPVAAIRNAGFDLLVSRFRISPHYYQAMFMGGGIAFADRMLKRADRPDVYGIADDESAADASFEGLECRWRDVPSHYGEIISLLALATTGDPRADQQVYGETVAFLEDLFAGTDQPIRSDQMHLSTRLSDVRPMAGFAGGPGNWNRLRFQVRTVLENMYFWVARKRGTVVRGMLPEVLVTQTIAATDHRKFDDMLRMVLSSTPALRQELTDYLDLRLAKGELVYGMHISDRALLTCIVFEQTGPQVHFVDGADGGYAIAAAQLKSRIEGVDA